MCCVSLTNIEVQDIFGTTVATTTFPQTLRSYSAVRKSFSASIQGHGIELLQGAIGTGWIGAVVGLLGVIAITKS